MNVTRGQYTELLRRYLWPQRRRATGLGLLLAGSTGLQLLSPQLVRWFIDTATQGGALRSLVTIAVLFIAVALAGQVLGVAATYTGEWVGWSATNSLRADLAEHCLELDMSFHNNRTPGELIERIDGDVNTLSNFFSRLVLLVGGSVLLLAGVLALLWREDWRVGLSLSLFTLFSLVVLSRIRHIAVPAMAAERQANAELYGFLEERLSGLADLRSNGASSYVMQRFHHYMRNLFRKGRRAFLLGDVVWMATVG
ncbi:MAG: ABC transporter ATP-binding protein, partial [Actinomycetota bacterium]|nr:ABC transporter ATP-binding protein [Actinomycetota bacterium]